MDLTSKGMMSQGETKEAGRLRAKALPLSPEYVIIAVSLAARTGTLALSSIAAHLLPPFDSSHLVASPTSKAGHISGLRWDAIHFASVAVDGYQYEQQLAFMPGWLYLMRLAGQVLSKVSRTPEELATHHVVWGGQIIVCLCSVASAVMLYK